MRLVPSDVQNAWRSLGRTTWFTVWMVLLLTLTLGANALLFIVTGSSR